MENRNLKHITTNIDMDKIDFDSFGEGLLACVASTKHNCKLINRQVKHLATVAFVPWVSTMEQYDNVIDYVITKAELVELYKLFLNWSKGLDDRKKKLFVAYFVKKDRYLCVKVTKCEHYHKKYVLPISRSFMDYINKVSNIDIDALMKNPFVYGFYKDTLIKNEGFKKRGRWSR